jgi:putative transposase
MDPGHTLVAVRYVERNPVRAGLVPGAEEYPWSSAAGHTGRKVDSLLSDRQSLLSGIDNWSDWLKADDDIERVSRLKLYTRTGRPLGSETFTQLVELKTGRELSPKPHGRPRRWRS